MDRVPSGHSGPRGMCVPTGSHGVTAGRYPSRRVPVLPFPTPAMALQLLQTVLFRGPVKGGPKIGMRVHLN